MKKNYLISVLNQNCYVWKSILTKMLIYGLAVCEITYNIDLFLFTVQPYNFSWESGGIDL